MSVAALATGHKIGLAAVGAVFIAFALLSSFAIPRRNPNYPGRGLGWFVVGTIVLFASMMAAVLYFGREGESKAAEKAGTEEAATAPATTAANASTRTTPTTGISPSSGSIPTGRGRASAPPSSSRSSSGATVTGSRPTSRPALPATGSATCATGSRWWAP
jgi:hypothetical protein